MFLKFLYLSTCIFKILALDPLFITERKFRNGTALRITSENYCLQNINTTSFREDCTVFLMHIHKAGGTTVCNIARKNGVLLPHDGKFNCNMYRPDLRKDKPETFVNINSTRDPCRQDDLMHNNNTMLNWKLFSIRRATRCIASRKYGLISGEDQGVGFPVSKSVVHIAVLRDPVDRCYSLLRHEKRETGNLNGTKWDMLGKMNITDAILRSDNIINAISFECSNMMLKAYTGCGRHCRKTHLALAKRILDMTSVVIITEHFSRHVELLVRLFGWKKGIDLHLNADPRRVNRGRTRNFLKKNYPQVLLVLERWNQLDNKLLHYAMKLAEQRLLDAKKIHISPVSK